MPRISIVIVIILDIRADMVQKLSTEALPEFFSVFMFQDFLRRIFYQQKV